MTDEEKALRGKVESELEAMIGEMYRIRRKLHDAPNRAAVESEVLGYSLAIRHFQISWQMQGVSVFIAWDRSGLPIRVCRGVRTPLV